MHLMVRNLLLSAGLLGASLMAPQALAETAAETAETSAANAFEHAYAALQQAHQQQLPSHELRSYAQSAYQAASAYFGDEHINTAKMKLSFLNLLTPSQHSSGDFADLATSVLDTYESEYGADADELIPALMMVLRTQPVRAHLRKNRALFERLIEAAERSPSLSVEQQLRLKIDAATLLLAQGNPASRALLDFPEQAQQQLGASHDLTLLAEFSAARYLEVNQQTRSATDYFEKISQHPFTEQASETQLSIKYMSHARLVATYEGIGESDKATKHCLAIAAMGRGIGDEEEPTPIYRVNPKFPPSMARDGHSGSTVLMFDINKLGMVENIRVEEASHKAWARAATKALQQWRYAPRYVNGASVDTANRKVVFDFNIRR